MPRPTRIYSIDSIQFALTKSNPPGLLVMASGRATSTGWTDIKLEPLEKTLSPDGILDLAFVGVPPQGISIPMLTPVSAHFVWKDADGVIGVKIHARSNELTRLLLEQRGPAITEMVGEQGGGPEFADLTTLAIGEEGPPITQIAGEHGGGGHGPFTTLMLGEEHSPTTHLLGEEGHPPTTLAIGEEGHPTTHPIGEEFFPKTFVHAEESPPTITGPAEGITFTHGENPASIPRLEDPLSTVSAELGPWRDPLGPIETGGINAFGRR